MSLFHRQCKSSSQDAAAGARVSSRVQPLAIAVLAGLLALWGVLPGRVWAEGPVQFGPVRAKSYFPARIVFEVQANSSAAMIVAAGTYYRVQGDDVIYHLDLPVRPGRQVDLRYELDTRGLPVPPGAQVFARWEARDAAGNQASSPEVSVDYDDTRFAWQRTANEQAEVWWHDLPADAGPLALQIANEALEYQHRIYRARPAYPVHIFLYNSQEELTGWQAGAPDFTGGRAFPAQGVTAQVYRPGIDGGDWLHAVIPHELAHLYFYQAAYHPRNPAPQWLDEGLALYTEFVEHQAESATLERAVVRHALIPLAELAGDFGTEEARVRLAQAEALSAVTCLMQTHGPEEVAALLAAYRAGLSTAQAFQSALGTGPAAFEEDWLAWLGVPKAWRTQRTPITGQAETSGGIPTADKATIQAAVETTTVVTGTAVMTTTTPVSPATSAGEPNAPGPAMMIVLLAVGMALPAVLILAIDRARRRGGEHEPAQGPGGAPPT